MIIGRFIDEDFGEVNMDLSKETGTMVIADLEITNIPNDYDEDMIFRAWNIFKINYASYGSMCIDYNQISQMEQIIN
jgi:hypothetical protein